MVRGIRYHLSFAASSAVEPLCDDTSYGKLVRDTLSRSRNARLIMSNVIPHMPSPDVFPYCIWYPDLADEDTYRQLIRHYPAMRYQVGRACAVGGFWELYRKLDVLPEVSIAEEARESGVGKDIYGDIMSKPIRYAVMNDYTRSINQAAPRAGAFLNGDTTVARFLNNRRSLDDPERNVGVEIFDICEDTHLGEETSILDRSHLELRQPELLYNPLPADLPTVNKGLLILMAAYEGNVDRYARLRRPLQRLGLTELGCVVRGIHHSTTFAKWCSIQIDNHNDGYEDPLLEVVVKQAINARAIMCNDLSRVGPDTDDFEWQPPYLIWYPLKPLPRTLQRLAQIRPDMKTAVVQACIACDYQRTFDELNVEPTDMLVREAKLSHNKYYLEELLRRAEDEGIKAHYADQEFVLFDKEPTADVVPAGLWPNLMAFDLQGFYYDTRSSSNFVESFIWAPNELRRRARERQRDVSSFDGL